MLLSARALKDVTSVNSFESADELEWTEGDTLTVYFQLIDAQLDKAEQGFEPAGRRYVPAAGATLSCVLENIDDAKQLTRLATQPYAQDGSIWQLMIMGTDSIRGSPQLRLTLNEAGKITRGIAKLCIKIHPDQNLT